ncbi:MAG: hypothetical protein RDV48_03205 [Candidatus Eremiobacteraeota bacterium]|nr:hypothetical protein [Candidatus Eremiobacteraeota bacterium]
MEEQQEEPGGKAGAAVATILMFLLMVAGAMLSEALQLAPYFEKRPLLFFIVPAASFALSWVLRKASSEAGFFKSAVFLLAMSFYGIGLLTFIVAIIAAIPFPYSLITLVAAFIIYGFLQAGNRK